MRGKDNQWVRPHPGPFVWNNIEKEKGIFSWDKVDKYVTYAQSHNQNTIELLLAVRPCSVEFIPKT